MLALALNCSALFPSGREITKIVNHSSMPIQFDTQVFESSLGDYPDAMFPTYLEKSSSKVMLEPNQSYTFHASLSLLLGQLSMYQPSAGTSTRFHQKNIPYSDENALQVTTSYTDGHIIPIEPDEDLDLEYDVFITIKSHKIHRFDKDKNSENSKELTDLQQQNKLYRFYGPGMSSDTLDGETTFYYCTDRLGTTLHVYDPMPGEEEFRFS